MSTKEEFLKQMLLLDDSVWNSKQKEIEEFSKLLTEPEKVEEWPKKGDDYWVLMPYVDYLHWDGCKIDTQYKETGNCYRTKEEAEKEYEARKVTTELKACEGCVPYSNNCYGITIYAPVNSLNVFFKTQIDAEWAVQKVGAERVENAIKWILYGK